MEKEKIVCPYCGYRMPIAKSANAIARGLFVKCKGRNCGKTFEINIPPKED